MGYDPVVIYLICCSLNFLIYPILFLLLTLGLEKLPLVHNYINWSSNRNRKIVDKWGSWGLLIFVAIPLPLTGVYTATLLSWFLRIPPKKSSLPILTGVLIAGLIVMLTSIKILKLV